MSSARERERNVIKWDMKGGATLKCFSLKKFEAKTVKYSDLLKLDSGYMGLQSIIHCTFLNILLKCLSAG